MASTAPKIFADVSEYEIIEKGTIPDRAIQKSFLSRPHYDRVRVSQQASAFSATQGTPIIFNLPLDRYLVSYRAGCESYLEITAQATVTDGNAVSNFEWVNMEPWRIVDRMVGRINGTTVFDTNVNLEEAATMRMMDMPLDALTCDGPSFGVDIDQGYVATPFISTQAPAVTYGTRADASTGNLVGGAVAGIAGLSGGTGTAYTTNVGHSMTPSVLNRSVKLNASGGAAYKRFRIPMSLLINSFVTDADSLLPLRYLREVVIELYLANSWNCSNYYYDAVSDPDYNSHVTAATVPARPYNIDYLNPWFLINTIEVQPEVDNEFRRLLDSGSYIYRTEAEQILPFTFTVAPNGVGSSFNVPLQIAPASVKSIECCFTCPVAQQSAYTGWKSTHLDLGIYQFYCTLNGEQIPVQPGYNGYQAQSTPFSWEGWDAWSLYQNARKSKLAGRHYGEYLSASALTPWNFAGIGDLEIRYDNANFGLPKRAGYPLALNYRLPTNSTLAQLQDQLEQYTCGQRQFRICMDLSSVTKSDNLFSGSRGGQLQVVCTYGPVRNYYWTAPVDANSKATQVDTTQVAMYAVVTYNQLIRMGRSQAVVIGNSAL